MAMLFYLKARQDNAVPIDIKDFDRSLIERKTDCFYGLLEQEDQCSNKNSIVFSETVLKTKGQKVTPQHI